MTRRLVYTPEALAEMEAARDWYDDQQPGAGASFLDDLYACIELVSQFPEAFSKRRDGLRIATLRRHAYVVVYEYDEDAIRIAAVVHAARGSGYWQERFR